jgi:hypothetical protein
MAPIEMLDRHATYDYIVEKMGPSPFWATDLFAALYGDGLIEYDTYHRTHYHCHLMALANQGRINRYKACHRTGGRAEWLYSVEL